MHDSISLISYAGCLGLSPVMSAKIHSLNARRSLQSRKNLLKIPVFDFKVIQGHRSRKGRQQSLLY